MLALTLSLAPLAAATPARATIPTTPPDGLLKGLHQLNKSLSTAIDQAADPDTSRDEIIDRVEAIVAHKNKLAATYFSAPQLTDLIHGVSYRKAFTAFDCIDSRLFKVQLVSEAFPDGADTLPPDNAARVVRNLLKGAKECKDSLEKELKDAPEGLKTELNAMNVELANAEAEVPPSEPPGKASAEALHKVLGTIARKAKKIERDKHKLVLGHFFRTPVYGVPFNEQVEDYACIDAALGPLSLPLSISHFWTFLSGKQVEALLKKAKACKDNLEKALEAVQESSCGKAGDGVARDGVAPDGVARSGVARDGTAHAAQACDVTLTVTKSGTGSGSVGGDVASGIDCGSVCTGKYAPGTTVVLAATPDSGSIFNGWTGGCTNAGGSCTVTLSADTAVNAEFAKLGPACTAHASVSGGDVQVAWSGCALAAVGFTITVDGHAVTQTTAPTNLSGGGPYTCQLAMIAAPNDSESCSGPSPAGSETDLVVPVSPPATPGTTTVQVRVRYSDGSAALMQTTAQLG